MNKRQRKKYAKKCASTPIMALIESTRRLLRRDRPIAAALVNDAWRKLQNYLRDIQAMEVERIERGPMPWIGFCDQSEEFSIDDFSKASGTHAAAGRDELKPKGDLK